MVGLLAVLVFQFFTDLTMSEPSRCGRICCTSRTRRRRRAHRCPTPAPTTSCWTASSTCATVSACRWVCAAPSSASATPPASSTSSTRCCSTNRSPAPWRCAARPTRRNASRTRRPGRSSTCRTACASSANASARANPRPSSDPPPAGPAPTPPPAPPPEKRPPPPDPR